MLQKIQYNIADAVVTSKSLNQLFESVRNCLLYTSDAADERSSVDLGGRRIIKKQHYRKHSGRNDLMSITHNKQNISKI